MVMEMIDEYVVTENNLGQRIDNFLFSYLKGVPKSHIYRLLRTGQCRVNSKRIKAGYRLELSDKIRIPPVKTKELVELTQVPDDMTDILTSAIVFENDHYIIINKPVGLSVHGDNSRNFGVIEYFRLLRPDLPYLALAHRLDRMTTGCLLLAKSRTALLHFQTRLREGAVTKQYVCLSAGVWEGDPEITVNLPLVTQKNSNQYQRTQVGTEDVGKTAVTKFTFLAASYDYVYLRVHIHTGRTHQIRVHAASLDLPIVGDDVYGSRIVNQYIKQNYQYKHMLLHAEQLIFLDGQGNEIMAKACLPEDAQKLLSQLIGPRQDY